MRSATPESPRMFDNDVVDFFSRVPWYAVPIVFVPIIAGLLIWPAASGVGTLAITAQFAFGWFVWTLTEYWLHRTLFHWQPKTSWGPRFHFIMHGVHHKWFQDRLRLVMPPAASLGLGVLFFGMYSGIASLMSSSIDPSWVYAFFAGKVTGYVVYDLTHYYIHHAKPKTRMGKALRAHHNKHHHNRAYKDLKFGVSTTVWDHVFGTYEVADKPGA
jgi:dihydroceramide fatty acyl 2-hydroxylase